MQNYDTKAKRHEFTIDGRQFWLPGVTLADFENAAKIDALDDQARIPVFRDFIASRVRPRWRGGRRAARRLNILQVVELWKAWVGLPGEALSSSSASSENTETSSPTTSETSTPAPSGE